MMVEFAHGRLKAPTVTALLTTVFSLSESSAAQTKLFSRLKVLRAAGFPDTIETDRDLRKGYTPIQVLRLIAVFTLIDLRYALGDAISLARKHDTSILALMSNALDRDFRVDDTSLIGVIQRRELDSLRQEPTKAPEFSIALRASACEELHHDLNAFAATLDFTVKLERAKNWLAPRGIPFTMFADALEPAREAAAI
jgi:hypothetical protein